MLFILTTVMAGFPNPLPDTLHLFLVGFGFSVYTCVFDHAYACMSGDATWPAGAYLLVARDVCVSRFTPVHVSRALDLRMTKLHCLRVVFSRLTCVFRTKSDWICEPRAFPVRTELVVREFGRT